jgi:hypothetical protein
LELIGQKLITEIERIENDKFSKHVEFVREFSKPEVISQLSNAFSKVMESETLGKNICKIFYLNIFTYSSIKILVITVRDAIEKKFNPPEVDMEEVEAETNEEVMAEEKEKEVNEIRIPDLEEKITVENAITEENASINESTRLDETVTVVDIIEESEDLPHELLRPYRESLAVEKTWRTSVIKDDIYSKIDELKGYLLPAPTIVCQLFQGVAKTLQLSPNTYTDQFGDLSWEIICEVRDLYHMM